MAGEKKRVKKDPKRFVRLTPPGSVGSVVAKGLPSRPIPVPRVSCQQVEDAATKLIQKACSTKVFEETAGNCGGGGGATAPVDLVVVIDRSGSMGPKANNVSNAANAAIQAASKSCPSDLRVAWFGIEGTWPRTNFNQSYRDYLHGLGVVDTDIVGTPNDSEDGAAAVIDLSYHFDWRAGAARAIFYLGDEALEGGDPQVADDVTARIAATDAAKAQGVTVFTYYGPSVGDPVTANEYALLASNTGGQAFTAPVANLGGFQAVLEHIICASAKEACQRVEEPKIVPCLRLRWGDGLKDQIETEDTEILCISVCNPYSNVVLKDFTLHLVVTDVNGNLVANLPNGTPSVQLKPSYMIGYGDIPPCDPDKPDQPSCVTREVVLINRGAIAGKYKIRMVYCFDACFTTLDYTSVFDLVLVKS